MDMRYEDEDPELTAFLDSDQHLAARILLATEDTILIFTKEYRGQVRFFVEEIDMPWYQIEVREIPEVPGPPYMMTFVIRDLWINIDEHIELMLEFGYIVEIKLRN